MVYPKLVRLEMLRIDREWSPRKNSDGRTVRRLPGWLEHVVPAPGGKEKRVWKSLDVLIDDPAGLGHVREFCRRQAMTGLARFKRNPSGGLARKIAGHMMRANLVTQFLNQALKQDPLTDLPFPL